MAGRRARTTAVRRTAAGLAAGALALLAGCGTTLTPEEMTRACTGFAAEVSKAGLAGTPTQAQAKAVADALDGILPGLRDPRVHDAGVALHTHLHGVDTALAKGDTARAADLAAKARADVTKAARACGLPQSAFLEG
ncbi:hypothetical protein [Kineosporia sp. R_H_3]|uniref:hypothetical protein n=1 Tax=Kineosporia sp. R_H_3 TaxID=1961848 RepID=UPI000B4B8D32|nr:hypothetical protein [Kineosporia sp. R_H_3]